MVIILWFLVHFLISCVLLISQKMYTLFTPLFIIIYIVIYAEKPVTYDLTFYLNYFLEPFDSYEILFYYLTKILTIFNDANITHIVICLLAIFLFIYSLRALGLPLLMTFSALPIYLGSIYFVLGSQNVIRQFLSSSIIIFFLSYLISKLVWKRNFIAIILSSIVVGLMSSMIHFSGFFFSSLVTLLLLIWINVYKKRELRVLMFLLIFFSGVLSSLVVVYFLQNSNMYIYVSREIDWGGERFSNLPKILFLSIYLFITHFLSIRLYVLRNFKINILNNIRLLYAFYIIPFGIFTGEAFSRLMFFFYAIDTLFCCSLLYFSSLKIRLLIAFIFLIYAVTPNVLNILGFKIAF